MQYYLYTLLGGGGSNGSGTSKEHIPQEWQLEYGWDDLNDYLTKGKTIYDSRNKKLDDCKETFPPKSKLSDIKKEICN